MLLKPHRRKRKTVRGRGPGGLLLGHVFFYDNKIMVTESQKYGHLIKTWPLTESGKMPVWMGLTSAAQPLYE